MAQNFNPEHVLMTDLVEKGSIRLKDNTETFIEHFTKESLLTKLGRYRDVGDQRYVDITPEELSGVDGYFVGEGEKIGTSIVKPKGGQMKPYKIGVILPITHEAQDKTWGDYFKDAVPAVAKAFAKALDSAVFLGVDAFGSKAPIDRSIIESARKIEGDLTVDNILDLEDAIDNPQAFIGHKSLNKSLRHLSKTPVSGEYTIDYVKPLSYDDRGIIDYLPYFNLELPTAVQYPEDKLLIGNFDNLLYAIRNGEQLRVDISNSATLTKVNNTSPDSGALNLFEQDTLAARFIFEFELFVPDTGFAVLEPAE